MSAYYNEFDPQAAAWLRELIKKGHIASGDVDERDMREVTPDDLKGYTQHHFFAGIGGWSYALRLAGWEDSRPVLTGSPPCQPFSTAGKQLGVEDERHLAPVWLKLVAAIRPAWVFGEQVAAAVSKDYWLDDLLDALETEGYTTGALVLPACSVGAPHIRQRLWFTGRLGNSLFKRLEGHSRDGNNSDEPGWLNTQKDRSATETGGICAMVNNSKGRADQNESTNASVTGWDSPDWLFCKDGKWRPVESGTFPLANGVPAPVGRLRGYGNAIVPQVAAEIIKTFVKN